MGCEGSCGKRCGRSEEGSDLWGELWRVCGVGGVGLYPRGVCGGSLVCGAVEFIYTFEFDSAVLGVGPTSI